jgi:hypothetical protein
VLVKIYRREKENREITPSFSAQTHLTHFSAVNLGATILNAPIKNSHQKKDIEDVPLQKKIYS